MSEIVYRICALLGQVLQPVPVGTNLGLFALLWALLSGRFLLSRGAVFPALSDLGLTPEAVRRSGAALGYGRFVPGELWEAWHKQVQQEGSFTAHQYEGYSPVACDLTGFFRPRLAGCTSKHYRAEAGKALPAIGLALLGAVGSVGPQRFCLPRLLLRAEPTDPSEAALQRRALQEAAQTLSAQEVLVVDAGFALSDLVACRVPRFVARVRKNATLRYNCLPTKKQRGRPAEYGEVVRPLARVHAGKTLAATRPDKTARWKDGRHTLRAHLFENLTLPDQKPGETSLRCVVIFDPRYQEPMVLVTNLPLSAYALWRLYRDRWAIEQLPQAAKPLLGGERAFVFGQQSRYRLPELALLAGNLLTYIAATSQPVATGFWDRCARPTCGRLRRQLSRVDFSKLPGLGGELRKKAVVTAHLPKGVKGHRRQKAAPMLLGVTANTTFTGK
jgi:hypothetical protein